MTRRSNGHRPTELGGLTTPHSRRLRDLPNCRQCLRGSLDAVREVDANGAGLNLRVSSQRGLDLLLDIRRLNRRLDGYGIGYADDAQQFPEGVSKAFF